LSCSAMTSAAMMVSCSDSECAPGISAADSRQDD
jgi:hypothetical protein